VREIETIKVCQNAEVMKGCSSLKKVIDITLRKKENGTTGRWGLFGDTYGGAKGIVSVISQQDKLRVLSHVEGNFQRTSSSDKDAYQGISGTTVNHYSHEGAKLNLLWTPTAKKGPAMPESIREKTQREIVLEARIELFMLVLGQVDLGKTLGQIGVSYPAMLQDVKELGLCLEGWDD
jgi:hypothetical protein